MLLHLEGAPGLAPPELLRLNVYDEDGLTVDGQTVELKSAGEWKKLPQSMVLTPARREGRLRLLVRAAAGGKTVGEGATEVALIAGAETPSLLTIVPGALADTDRDGVPDVIDRCVDRPNPRQGACTERDGGKPTDGGPPDGAPRDGARPDAPRLDGALPPDGPRPPDPIRIITFEDGQLVHPLTGVESTSGTVDLESTKPLRGKFSALVPGNKDSYLHQSLAPAKDLYVTFTMRLEELPPGTTRFLNVSASGSSLGNLQLRSSGKIVLRLSSDTVGYEVGPLVVGTLYRLGLHQRAGSGKDGVLEAYLAVGDAPFGAPFAGLKDGKWTSAADGVRLGATSGDEIDATFDDLTLDRAALH
ncbi:MAG: hypothetical protein IT371_03615 [Deltaproteobacteria bacterium]|nr:hypothetical protein [Deltaproteobacteria bacterium]